jgi:hypothetical protein
MKFAIVRSLSGEYSNGMKFSKNAGAMPKKWNCGNVFFAVANAINVPKRQVLDFY